MVNQVNRNHVNKVPLLASSLRPTPPHIAPISSIFSPGPNLHLMQLPGRSRLELSTRCREAPRVKDIPKNSPLKIWKEQEMLRLKIPTDSWIGRNGFPRWAVPAEVRAANSRFIEDVSERRKYAVECRRALILKDPEQMATFSGKKGNIISLIDAAVEIEMDRVGLFAYAGFV